MAPEWELMPSKHVDRKVVRAGDFQVWADYVLIFGQRLNRPNYLSPSMWVRFWEHF